MTETITLDASPNKAFGRYVSVIEFLSKRLDELEPKLVSATAEKIGALDDGKRQKLAADCKDVMDRITGLADRFGAAMASVTRVYSLAGGKPAPAPAAVEGGGKVPVWQWKHLFTHLVGRFDTIAANSFQMLAMRRSARALVLGAAGVVQRISVSSRDHTHTWTFGVKNVQVATVLGKRDGITASGDITAVFRRTPKAATFSLAANLTPAEERYQTEIDKWKAEGLKRLERRCGAAMNEGRRGTQAFVDSFLALAKEHGWDAKGEGPRRGAAVPVGLLVMMANVGDVPSGEAADAHLSSVFYDHLFAAWLEDTTYDTNCDTKEQSNISRQIAVATLDEGLAQMAHADEGRDLEDEEEEGESVEEQEEEARLADMRASIADKKRKRLKLVETEAEDASSSPESPPPASPSDHLGPGEELGGVD